MEYRGAEPSITVEVSGNEPVEAVLAVCCNARPFAYFKRFPVEVCPQARSDSGLDLLMITKIRATTIPRIAWGILVSRNHVNGRTADITTTSRDTSWSRGAPYPSRSTAITSGSGRAARCGSCPRPSRSWLDSLLRPRRRLQPLAGRASEQRASLAGC
jgi:hypothetical protein